MTDDLLSWVRIDAFLAEKYHYTPQQISQLTPTECLWLCIAWDKEESSLKVTEHTDDAIKHVILTQQQKLMEKSMEYHGMTAEEKLRLAARGILSAGDYIKDHER